MCRPAPCDHVRTSASIAVCSKPRHPVPNQGTARLPRASQVAVVDLRTRSAGEVGCSLNSDHAT